MEINLPIPMPTWNRILAMQHFQRKDMRRLLHECVSLSITHGLDWPTSTVYQGKPRSTGLLLLEYLQTIRPSKSRKSDITKLKASLKSHELSLKKSSKAAKGTR